MSETPRKGEVGDWFVVPLPGGAGVAVAHAVRAQRDGTVLAYFFGPFPEPPPLTVCADLDPADAETALVCGARALETGDWPLLGRTDVDPDVWPVPEFEKRVNVAPGRQESFAVRKEADLLRDAATRPLPDSERGQRPFNGVFGDVAVVRHLAFRISAAEPRVGRQPWWAHPPPTDPTDGSDQPTDPPSPHDRQRAPDQHVLLSLPPDADPDEHHDDLVETLTDAVDAAGLGEVDGTLRGPDTLEVYLYGPDAAALADLVAQVVRSHRVSAGATLTVRRGAPGTPTETQPLS